MASRSHWLKLKTLISVLLASVASSMRIQRGLSPGEGVGGALYYGIGSQRVNVVCPVTAGSHTILQPVDSPRLNGSFYGDGLDDYERAMFSLVHVEEACYLSPNEVAATFGELCDRVYIINRGNLGRRGNFTVSYHTFNGTVIVTSIFYGPEGVSLVNSIPESGTLPVSRGTRLEYELRKQFFTGQSSINPILCERMANGQFGQSFSFFLLPNSNTQGCQSSLNSNGFSMPYVTTVFPANLSLLFSDPTTIYLAYGSCNSTEGPVSSRINITVTAESTTPISTTHHASTTTSVPPLSNRTATPTRPATQPAAMTSEIPTVVKPTTGETDQGVTANTVDSGDGVPPRSTAFTNMLTPTAGPIAEVTQATTLHDSTHFGSTHIATSTGNDDLVIVISVIATTVVTVVITVVFVLVLRQVAQRFRKKSVALPHTSNQPAEVKVKDVPPALSLPCPGLDSDSGVVASSGTGGTPVSNCNFAMSGQEEISSPRTASFTNHNRESDLTDSSVSSVILKTVSGVNKIVSDTYNMLEDMRDNMFADQLSSNQNPGESS